MGTLLHYFSHFDMAEMINRLDTILLLKLYSHLPICFCESVLVLTPHIIYPLPGFIA